MGIQLKKLVVSKTLSEETTAFTADVYFNGLFVCNVKNNGRGGCNNYHYENWRNQPIVESYAKEQLKGTHLDFGFENLDVYISVLIEINENLKGHQSKKLVFQKSFTDPEFTMIVPFKVGIKDAIKKSGLAAIQRIKKIVLEMKVKGYVCLNTNIQMINFD